MDRGAFRAVRLGHDDSTVGGFSVAQQPCLPMRFHQRQTRHEVVCEKIVASSGHARPGGVIEALPAMTSPTECRSDFAAMLSKGFRRLLGGV